MFQIKTTQEFRCEYCPKTYSKRSSLQNHLRTHRDQMYLNETGLFGEENTYISHPLQEANRPSMRNEQDLTLEDSYWQDDNDIYGNYDENPSSSEDLNENLSEISNKTSSNNSDENLNEVSNTNLSDNSGENLSETSNAKSDENISSIESDDDKNYDTPETIGNCSEVQSTVLVDVSPDYITNDKGEQERCYSELYNSDWWGRAQRSINESAKKHAMAKHQLFQRSMNILVIEPIMSVMSDGLDLRTDDGNIKRFTADEFRAMMRQLVFVIDGIIPTLHKTDYTKKQAKNIDKQLVQLYVDWNKMYIYSRKDKFTESDLKTFKSLIIIWAKGFKKLFSSYSVSQLQLPKFHSWVYHIISSITEYGAVNNFTTETYETLHKEYVKNPYRMSNKRDASSQMLRTVSRDALNNHRRSTTSINKQHSKSTMNGEIATFKLSLFDEFITTYKANNVLAPEALEAFNQFIIALNRFFSLLEEFANNDVNYETITIKWYSSAVISSSDSIRANSNWYKQAVFDNISINMHSEEVENYITQDGMCFGKVLMLCSVNISSSNYDTFDLALVQWYDYKDARELEKYGCPWLIQTSQYEFIPVESGVEPVHIIQRFIKNDEFFVNVFMF
ncbi:unnamed protein product [Rhizophagus irregularis]|nr:unnamed protein product [Rhizophagus irregularis]